MGVLIRVLVTACTSGPLLETQGRALARHMACDYELTVVNDAKDEEHFSNMWAEGKAEEISAAISAVAGRELRFPQAWHTDRTKVFPQEPEEFAEVENANTRCADAVQYGVSQLLRESYEPLLILDADMVSYQDFDPDALLDEYPVWGVLQFRQGIVYLWNGLILVDPRRAAAMNLFNLDCAHVFGIPCDVGGMLYRFVEVNRSQIGTFLITSSRAHTFSDNGSLPGRLRDFFRWDSETQDQYRLSETYGRVFAHLGGGGNWEVRDKAEAEERVQRFIEAVS